MKTKGKIQLSLIFAFILIFLAFAILFYILIFKINSDGSQCTLNPLVYGFDKLQEVNKYPLMCSCNLLSSFPSQTLHFNSTSQWYTNPIIVSSSTSDNINYSNIFKDLIIENDES